MGLLSRGGGRTSQNHGLRWKDGGVRDYLAFLIADAPVELLPLQAQEVLPRLDDAALGRNGPGCVDVVPGHHADSNASTLAFADSFRDLEETREMGVAIEARHICVWAVPFPPSGSAVPSPNCGPYEGYQ